MVSKQADEFASKLPVSTVFPWSTLDLVRPAHRIAPESQVTGCVSEGLVVVLYVYPTETAFVPKNYG
jgi:hypothetical protein